MTREDFVKAFPAFRNSPPGLMKDLLSSGRRQAVPANTPIYAEGDACQAIAFVLSGEIRVYTIGESGREITLYEIGPGETCILNVSCILGNTAYPANAVTTSDAAVLLVPSPDFRRLMSMQQEMCDFVFSLLSQRLTTVMELVEEVAFGRMDQRLREYLIEKSGNNRLETTHQKIANDLGTSREVVSRLLKDFERKQQVRLSRNVIEIVNMEG